ncbi:uncharacterized protein LOC131079139 [Cryptomeria japonica]|uniref:uncharacterized protein LOC131079139 n=1 Tax=Cryptomeria japonica TaxID=3369 RepID=UPI0027DA052A|nr:uncharacterized protein LOC131079139 [Cryptomeria japonica]
MPRPGPRPYECIRRAWHSDRHHPLRGRLIQEIFRIADEIHTPTTRRNKEWQKKLPLVVLRAEEILYSKANSEAEYVDLKTLRSRIEDAVNIMIRRDESTENGQYLEPCVEAALYVGCPPKKASRNQRHISRFCVGSSQSLATSSATPLIGKCNDYEGSSLVSQGNTQEIRFTNAEYCTGVSSSLGCEQYSIMPIHATPVCPSSVVCTPRVDTIPSTNDAIYSLSNPCSTGNINRISFNRGIPSAWNGPSQQQPFSRTNEKGAIVHPLDLQTRFDTRLLCMPVPWSLSSASTCNAMSAPWCVTPSFQLDVSNRPSIGFPSHAILSPVVAELPTPCMDSGLQFQVHPVVLKDSIHTEPNSAKYTTELCSFDGTHGTYKSFQSSVERDSSAEVDCKTASEDACDLHLRLGPSSNPCFHVATTGSYDIEDLESSNSRAKAQVEDQALEILKVNDSFGSGSESNQDFHCFSPSLSSGFGFPEALPRENIGLHVNRYTINQATDVEMPSLKRSRCDKESMVSQIDVNSTDHQQMCELQMGLGLSLPGRSSDI